MTTKALKKGRILGFYNGVMRKGEGKDQENEYNLKLEHLDDRGGAYIDGTPGTDIESYRLSLINGDYTETMTMHNCGIDEFGRITMTKNVNKGKKLLMHYGLDEKGGSSYNWERLDEAIVRSACQKTLRLTKILSAEEISQLEGKIIKKNSIYEKVRGMVMGWVKP